MDEFRATVSEMAMRKTAMETKIKNLVDKFESETGLYVATLRLDRFRRGLGHRQPPYRVEAEVTFWPKHTMEDLERDRAMQRLKKQQEKHMTKPRRQGAEHD